MHGLDIQTFHWINGWSDLPRAFFVFFSEATKAPAIRVILGLLALGLLIYRNTRIPTFAALIAFPLADGFTHLLKNSINMMRPCVELPDTILRVGLLDGSGVASSHAANTAAIAFVFTRYFKLWGLIPIAVSLITGISRIYVGVHFPSQVLLGWTCGILVGLVVTSAIEWVRKRLAKDVPEEPVPEQP